MAYPASQKLPATAAYYEGGERSTGLKVLAVFLGLAVGILIPVAVWLAVSAHNARDDARDAAASAASASSAMPGMSHTASAGTAATPSYAGTAPANADELAAAHVPYPAALPATPAGAVANVQLTLRDQMIRIAPGIKYSAWLFARGAPGPVIHVRQGQTVRITLTNDAAIPHSIDFHAARIAPNVAFVDVAPGKSITYSFKARDAGVFMYHCGTKPVLMHIANGMYGAIVVDPAKPLPRADRSYVLVAGEWYLDRPGTGQPAQFDMGKARAMMPDWVTWNGYAGQYVKHPLTANPGDLVRFYVVDAGPSLDADFHVVGTILNRAYVDADTSHFLRNVQTVTVPAGGGGIFDVKIDQPGLYPFVSHSFASVDMGLVGLLKVGNVTGTMSH